MSDANTQQIGGVLSRFNQLGAAAEQVFRRLYTGLNERTEADERQRRRAELKQKIETARRVNEQNKRLKYALTAQINQVERLEGILDALDEGIIMQDNEGRIVFSNQAARDLVGSQKNIWESEIGTLFDAYRDVEHVSSEIVPLGEPQRVQTNNRVIGAQLAAVANDKGERLGTMIVLRDVTQDAVTERLKDQFVTALSHELKTPMTVIKGMSEVLRNQADQPPNQRLLATLSRNVDILDRMVIELLDVSEIGAGTFDIRETPLHFDVLLNSVVSGMAPEIQKKNIEVVRRIREQDSLQIKGDEQRLRWALGHLLQNSVYYNVKNGRVMIGIGLDNENPEFVTLHLRDTGVGISERDLPHVFERFYRGDPRDAQGKLVDPRGLGQGLYIVRAVAEAHGGYVTVDSTIGQGSTFTLALPTFN